MFGVLKVWILDVVFSCVLAGLGERRVRKVPWSITAVLIGHKNAISVTQHMLSRLIQDYKVRASG